MKTGITFIYSAILFTALVAFTSITTDGLYTINTRQSTIEWIGTKITGKSHFGTINLQVGWLTLKQNKIVGGQFTIDMTSISCTDIEDPKSNKKLVDHLNNEDFFAVNQFETAHLTIISSDDYGNVKAKLTIKDITKDVSFRANTIVENGVLTASANIEIDRSKFDIRYGSDSFFDNLGDKVINNTVQFNITLTGKSSK
ncbi:YceI family protein [Bacteroidota bacterium]